MSTPRRIVGMDFGTTNSGMAVFDGHNIALVPLDESNRNPYVARTALYITNDQKVHIGREAITTYLAQNTGRPIRMERVWVGEIEVRGADMYYVDDLYVFTDIFSPGRLFLSIKSGLREPDYHGTVVGQFYFALEDLIALYLHTTRLRAERVLGHEVREVVLGRPVRFAFEPEKDKLAQARLLDAAFRAGYERVGFQYEPIAAAYHYAQTAVGSQNLLIFDFGGGTLDITIMRLENGQKRILANGGIPIAGDVFDQKLVRAKLPRHFGEGSTYHTRHADMPIPSWIYDIFSDWQHVLELQTPERRALLAEIAATAARPAEINALISLVSNNHALQMFEAAEQAKRRLSDDMGTLIKLDGPDFSIRQLVTRTDFEAVIRDDVERVRAYMLEMVSGAGLRPADIDIVVRTGGSAEIPIFRRLLAELFGEGKVRHVDTFSSVTSGLGVVAHEVAMGNMEMPAYTPTDLPAHVGHPQSKISPINLQLLLSRVALQEQGTAEQPITGTHLVLVSNGNEIITLPHLPVAQTAKAVTTNQNQQWVLPLWADYDETLLLVTSTYRFVRISARQWVELGALGMSLADVYHFRPQEEVAAVCRWADMTTADWLTLATTRGYVRAYRLDTLRPLLESPAPFQFDEALSGVPVAILGASQRDEILLANGDGRAIRLPLTMQGVRVRGVQALNWREGERIVGAMLAPADPAAQLLVVTAEGYGKVVTVGDIPLAKKGNERPGMLLARKGVCGLAAVTDTALLLTSDQVVPLGELPTADDTTKTTRLLKLGAEERLMGVVAPLLS